MGFKAHIRKTKNPGTTWNHVTEVSVVGVRFKVGELIRYRGKLSSIEGFFPEEMTIRTDYGLRTVGYDEITPRFHNEINPNHIFRQKKMRENE